MSNLQHTAGRSYTEGHICLQTVSCKPISGGLCKEGRIVWRDLASVCAGMIVTAVITLLRYIQKGRLYIFGGGFIAIGAHLLMTELLLGVTFGISFVGWSIYPLIALSMLGIFRIFLANNSNAREKMERKLFL